MVYTALSDDASTVSQFTRRKKNTITTDGTSTPSSYQVKHTTSYESAMDSDFADIRFSTKTGSYIDYWIQEYTASTTATVLIEFPDAITDPGSDYCWMYYGNSNLSDGGDIGDTFTFGDDFNVDKTKWTGDTTYLTLSGGTGILNATGSSHKLIYSSSSFAIPYIVESSLKRPTGAGILNQFGMIETYEVNNTFLHHDWAPTNQLRTERADTGRQEISTNITTASEIREKFSFESSSSVRWYFDDVEGTNSPYTDSDNIPTVSMPVAYGTYGNANFELYWVFVRKYIANEPTPSYGNEEHQRRTPGFI